MFTSRLRKAACSACTAVLTLALSSLALQPVSADRATDRAIAVMARPLPVRADLFNALPANIKSAKLLRIGTPARSAPSVFHDPASGEIVGLLPDLMNGLGRVLGVKIEFVETAFPGLLPGLQAGRLDLAGGNLYDTVEREQAYDFVSYQKTLLSMLSRNDKLVRGLSDVCGKTVAVLAGTGDSAILGDQSTRCEQSHREPVTEKTLTDFSASLTQLRAGNVDAVDGGNETLQYIAGHDGDGKTFHVALMTQGAGKFDRGTLYGLASSKSTPQLATVVAQALQALAATGYYRAVFEKWEIPQNMLAPDKIAVNGAAAFFSGK